MALLNLSQMILCLIIQPQLIKHLKHLPQIGVHVPIHLLTSKLLGVKNKKFKI